MSTSTGSVDGMESRVLNEGYGPGAWHGADLKAALANATPELAFWRPAAGRHNIAEIALHHAFCARAVRSQLSGRSPEPFVLPGEDRFDVPDERTLSWPTIQAAVESEQRQLGALVADIEAGKATSPLADTERFNLVLGITCHAIYHAGQIQLIKRLREEYKVASIRKELAINAPAEHVWAAVRDVGAVHTRLGQQFVVDTRLEGDSRVVTFANGEVARERIVDIDDRARRLADAVVEWRTSHHNASFQVIPDGDRRCRVVWITDLLPDTLAELVEGFMEQGCGDQTDT